jgi:hypothetical protein
MALMRCLKLQIDDAVRMYEAVEPFQFMHCWKILRNEPKWNDKVLELNSNSAGTGGKVLHKQTQLLLQCQREVMRIACLLDPKEETVLKERESRMLPHPAQQLMFFNAFTTTGRSANRKKMNRWFRSLLGKMRNSAFKGNI